MPKDVIKKPSVKTIRLKAKCCFFLNVDDKITFIKCEGIIDGTSDRVFFRHKSDRQAYIEDYCCGDYTRCRRAVALYSKYGVDITKTVYFKDIRSPKVKGGKMTF